MGKSESIRTLTLLDDVARGMLTENWHMRFSQFLDSSAVDKCYDHDGDVGKVLQNSGLTVRETLVGRPRLLSKLQHGKCLCRSALSLIVSVSQCPCLQSGSILHSKKTTQRCQKMDCTWLTRSMHRDSFLPKRVPTLYCMQL
jgi:hypothetical protein